MRRLHLFEFCDQPWFGGVFREGFMDCLNQFNRVFRFYEGAARAFHNWSAQRGMLPVLDLASGGGDHIEMLLRGALRENITLPQIVLSDLYPQTNHFRSLVARWGEKKVKFLGRPISALDTKDTEFRMRSCFSAFHHFDREQARLLIKDSLRNGDGLFIAECLHSGWLAAILIILGIIPSMCAPFFSERISFSKVFFSTVLPIVPLIVVFDGLVSMLRLYSVPEIWELVPEEYRNEVEICSGTYRFYPFLDATYVTIMRRVT